MASGETPGAKRAAVRKLKHELGIVGLVPAQFKFLTRLKYWAADTVTHGPSAEWGENEVDYILFAQANVALKPNPEEVDEVRYVTKPELAAMMADPALQWSPWFRIIVAELLVGGKGWWQDLDAALKTDKFVDTKSIFAFGPPFHGLGFQHQGCYRPSQVGAVPVAKQGAYGKLKTHGESKLSQVLRVDEVFSAVYFTVASPLKGQVDPLRFGPALKEDVLYCDKMLGKVRAAVALDPPPLKACQ